MVSQDVHSLMRKNEPARSLGRRQKLWYLMVGLLILITGCSPQVPTEELLQDALSALRRRDHPAAKTILDGILKQHPQNADALLYRAQLARDLNDDAAALEFLARIPDEPAKQASAARFLEGAIFLAMNRARQAELKLLESTALNPVYVHPHDSLLRLYVLQRRKVEMLAQLDALSKLRPLELPELALQLTAGEPMVDPVTAIPQLKSYVDADSGDAESRLALALYYREAVRPLDAIGVLQKLVKAQPKSPIAKAALAEVFVEQQDLLGAGEVLQSLELTPDSPVELWKSAGIYLLACGDWEQAAQCFAVVVAKNSLDRATFRRLGDALKKAGHVSLAQIALNRTALIAQLRDQCETLGVQLSRNQLNASDLVQLADRLAELEEPDRASIWFEQALRLNPNSQEAHRGIRELQTRPLNTVAQLLAKIPRSEKPIKLRRHQSDSAATTTPVFTARAPIQFQDDHERLGIDFTYFNGESGFFYLIESMGGGVGVIDYDHDDWPDLFFPQGNEMLTRPDAPAKWHDQLFRNLAGKEFATVHVQARCDDPGYGQGVAVADFDNDGFDDLFITNYGASTLLRNQGDGTFEDVTPISEIRRKEMSTSCGWADFDQDGLLDLFVVNYVDGLKVCRNDQGKISVCSPSNHSGVDDRIYRNLGDGGFEDLTEDCGLSPGGKGLGLVLADLDDDGKVDIFVANDTSPNFLYRNQSAAGHLRFAEEGHIAGVSLSENGIAQAGMGIACGDFNEDLRLDLYVTYFYREANGLYLNMGNGQFQEETRRYGLYHPTLEMLGFGTQAVDFDLDGHLELVVANGHIDDQRARGIPWKMPPQLFVPHGPFAFEDQSRDAGEYFHGEYLGRAVARCDWNRDGRPDLIVVHQDRPAAVLTNSTETVGRHFTVKLRAVGDNRSAIGARVNLTCAGRTQRADVTSGDGYYCSNERTLEFGLGDANRVDRLEIVWPGGTREEYVDLPPDSDWIAVQSMALLPLVH